MKHEILLICNELEADLNAFDRFIHLTFTQTWQPIETYSRVAPSHRT